MQTPEVIQILEILKQKVMAGGQLTFEEQQSAIKAMRENRISAGYASSAAKTKRVVAATPVRSAASLLAQLERSINKETDDADNGVE